MGYRYLDEVAIADLAFCAWGDTLEAVFAEAARATMNAMVEVLATIRFSQQRLVELRTRSAEWLLFDFLQEVIYYKDAEQLLLLPQHLEIGQNCAGWWLRGELAGEEIDVERHALLVDVKAVTLHRFSLVRQGNQWQAEVVLDI